MLKNTLQSILIHILTKYWVNRQAFAFLRIVIQYQIVQIYYCIIYYTMSMIISDFCYRLGNHPIRRL